uniref:uncharacterized protein LOC124050225 n=1 Tax=Scatophagus argus TaxID=75038 RepID=UPI001ED8177A|nr:uncharacterized protein LOC124050225 [Scatophagus argus]
MLLADAARFFAGFVLLTSGVQGQTSRICALKGSSVDLTCSPQHPASHVNWYTVHWDGSAFVRVDFSGDGNRTTYNTSGETNFTLTIHELRVNDTDFYCCGNITDNGGHCWYNRIQLRVTELQVKVIPTTEGHTVTLMCSTSCPLTGNPAAYMWYKNREFLYQDWSPWYQQLVSSEEAVRYSCAIKGYEDLRAPEVSVDSVTSSCFKVTYAGGTMCSSQQTSVDEPCSITYPTEVHIQRTSLEVESTRLTCTPNCPLTDPQTAYRWYWTKILYKYSNSQHFTVPGFSEVSCAVKGHEDLRSAEICSNGTCLTVNYVSRRVCAVEGSSVNIISEYSYQDRWSTLVKIWYKIKGSNKNEAEKVKSGKGRLEHHDSMNGRHILRIRKLRKNDSAEYIFSLEGKHEKWMPHDYPGVTLVVTGLNVTVTPSAVVTEGQRVTLTCSATSCPLTDNTNYIWYLDSRPLTLPQNQSKHLLLDPVSWQHAGNYSCALRTQKNTKSPEITLTVEARWIVNVVRLVVALLIPIPLLVFHLWMRQRRIVRTRRS